MNLLPPAVENHIGRASMQTSANRNLVLTDFSSFMRIAELEREISYAGLYQAIARSLVKSFQTEQSLLDVAERLSSIADHAHSLRLFDIVGRLGRIILNAPDSKLVESIGHYYEALSINQGTRGNTARSDTIFEKVSDRGPSRYRARAMLGLAGNALAVGDYLNAVAFYQEVMGMMAQAHILEPVTHYFTSRMTAVIRALDGDHRRALTEIENMFPLARIAGSVQPYAYYDYLNTLAVELTEAGRLEEARKASRIALASPFAPAYPEWRETSEHIELKDRTASRSTVAVGAPKVAGWGSGVGRQEAVGRRQKAEDREQKAEVTSHRSANVVALSIARLDAPAITPRQEPASTTQLPLTRARVIKFPSSTSWTQEDLSEKQMIVADMLWDMFQATIHDAPVNLGLIERLYKVFLNEQKPA